MQRFTYTVAAFSAVWIATCGIAEAATVTLAPHRAAYDLSLKSAAERSGITGVSGRMVIELEGSPCEGWTVNFRMVNQFTTARGQSRLVDTRSTSWEAGDGGEMSYIQRQFIDNSLSEETSLKAERGANGAKGKGEISKPSKQDFEIPADAVFPITHQLRLMQSAVDGQARERSVLFDGSDGSATSVAISFIGKERKEIEADDKLASLKDLQSWGMSVGYYKYKSTEGGEEAPDYQVDMVLYENGIAGDLTLDYGDFVLNAKLVQVDMLKLGDCKQSQ